jgi:hypothetical protein
MVLPFLLKKKKNFHRINWKKKVFKEAYQHSVNLPLLNSQISKGNSDWKLAHATMLSGQFYQKTAKRLA